MSDPEIVATWSPCCRFLRDGVHEPGVMHNGLCRRLHDGALGPTVHLVNLQSLDAERERIEKARAACATLGPLAVGVLAALDGDQALRDPYARSVDL